MANGHSEEFKRDAVRIALTSGLTRCQVAPNLLDQGVSASGPNQKWAGLNLNCIECNGTNAQVQQR